MSTTDSPAAAIPTAATERLLSLDVIRGIAVLGILACNIWGFGYPLHAWKDMGMMGAENYNRESFIAMMQFLDGTQRGLFSMLFGIGTAVFMERMEKRNMGIKGADLFFRRTFILFLFGLMNAFLFLWIGDILFHYACVTFIVYTFRKASIKTLLITVALLMSFTMFLKCLKYPEAKAMKAGYEQALQLKKEGKELSPEQQKDFQMWSRRLDMDQPKKMSEKEISKVRSGYAGSWEVLSSWSIRFETMYFYYGFFLDVLIMMLTGIAFYKMGVFSSSFPRARLLLIAVPLLATGWAIRAAKVSAIWGATYGDFDPLAQSYFAILTQPERLILVCGYLFILLYLCRLLGQSLILRPLAATGQMALTNYLSQSIICGFIFFGYGLGLYGTMKGTELYSVAAAIWLAQLIWSPLWLKYFQFGPFEWLWRSMTYGKRQPFRK